MAKVAQVDHDGRGHQDQPVKATWTTMSTGTHRVVILGMNVRTTNRAIMAEVARAASNPGHPGRWPWGTPPAGGQPW